MISPVQRCKARPLVVSGSPAAEWPLAGSSCPRAVGLQSVGYARGLLQRRSKVSRQIRPLEWTVTSLSDPCAAPRTGACAIDFTSSKIDACAVEDKHLVATNTVSLRSNFAVSHMVGGDVCGTDSRAVTWRQWAGPDVQRAESCAALANIWPAQML